MSRRLVVELSELDLVLWCSDPWLAELAMIAKVELSDTPPWEGLVRVRYPDGEVTHGYRAGSKHVEQELLPGIVRGYVQNVTQWSGTDSAEPFPFSRVGPLNFRAFRYEFDKVSELGATLAGAGPI